ncbi:MAG: hypothetical protein DRP18_05280, partial [Candidatus Aenigmatarchaeota archaeon]
MIDRKILIGVVLGIVFLGLMVSNASAWWNTSWSKRTPICINNTGNSNALTDYQVMINITYDSDMNSNFSDIRVVNDTSGETVPYWIENKSDGNWCKIWFNASYIPASSWCNDTYYLYYNNPSASSASDGDATFEFFDDFEDEKASFGQNLQWQKYSGNPILAPGSSGEWDDENIATAFVIKIGNTYHLWYEGNGNPDYWEWKIGHATSSDGITWTKDANNPVLEGTPGEWDAAGVWDPVVLYNTEGDGKYIMWYGGQDKPSNDASRIYNIGWATSDDGVNWTKKGKLSNWSDSNHYDIDVYYDGTHYHLYIYNYGQSRIEHYQSDTPDDFDFSSPDIITIEGETCSKPRSPKIYKDGETIYLYYSCHEQDKIYYATSENNWTSFSKQGIALEKSDSGWDSVKIMDGQIVNKSNEDYYLYYSSGDHAEGVGVATYSGPLIGKWKILGTGNISTITRDGKHWVELYAPDCDNRCAIVSPFNTVTENSKYIMKTRVYVVSNDDGFLFGFGDGTIASASNDYPSDRWAGGEYGRGHNEEHTLTEVISGGGDPWHNRHIIDSADFSLSNDTHYNVYYKHYADYRESKIGTNEISGNTTYTGLNCSHVHISASCGGKIDFEHVCVRKYASPEPTASLGSEEQQLYNVSGYVKTSSGAAIENAYVTNNVTLDTDYTNSTGYYNLSLPNGTYLIKAEKIGYASNTTTVTVSGADVSNANITLENADTTFTVTLPAGYTYAHFNLTGIEGASTKTNWAPEGQNSTTPFYNITNTGNVNLTVKMKINATIPNVILKADTD